MTPLGNILKSTFPSLYDFLTIKVLKTSETQVFYVMDAFGSFKTYFAENQMQPIIERLLKNMDQASIHTFNVVYKRLQNYPDSSCKQYIPSKKNDIIGGVLPEEEIEFDPWKIKKERQLKLITHTIHSSTFYFYHGLTLLPPKVAAHLNNKAVLDLGAYIGDSVLALEEYNFRKIYSVEMSLNTIDAYIRNLKAHHINEEKYEIIHCAVSDTNDTLVMNDKGSIGMSIQDEKEGNQQSRIEIRQLTIDSIIKEHNIKDLAFIKADLEGFALESVKGGIEAIKLQRPILSLAVYHNAKELFEVKPFLEMHLENYTFMLRRLAAAKEYGACHAETVLLAYPNELN